MTRLLLSGITVCLLMAGCAQEAEVPASIPNAPEARIGEKYEAIPSVLGLSATESAAFAEQLDRLDATLRAWMEGEKGQQLMQLDAEIRVKTEEKDLPGLRAVIAQATPLRNEIRGLIASSRNDLLDSLGPEGRLSWEAHEVASELLELMEPLSLDTTQEAQIRTNAIEQLRAAQSKNEPNPKAASFLELEQWAESRVLSPEQRDAYQTVKEDNPMRSLGV